MAPVADTYPDSLRSMSPSYPRSRAEEISAKLKKLLADNRVEIVNGSPFAECLEAVRVWASGDAARGEWLNIDVRREFQSGLGLTYFAANIVSVSHSSQFRALVPHLRLLGTATPSNAINVATASDATNKLFELVVACWAIRAGAHVTLEDPHDTSGEPNPDIIANVGADRILIACKETFSRSRETQFERIAEGFLQITRPQPPAFGLVVLHPRHLVPRDTLFPMRGTPGNPNDPPRFSGFRTEQEPFALVEASVMGLVKELGDRWDDQRHEVGDAAAARAAGFLIFTHAVASCVGMRNVVVDGKEEDRYGPYPISIPFTGLYGFPPLPPSVWAFCERLRDASVQSADMFDDAGTET